MKKEIEYAMYKGDTFLFIDTKSNICKRLNVSKRTVEFWSTPYARKRNKGNAMIALKLD